MKIIVRDTTDVYRHKVKQEVGKDATADDVLDYLFGKYGDRAQANFVIREWTKDKRTRLQRFNLFWLIPITAFLSPLRYIFLGHIGWDSKTKIGAWILRVTGYLRDA